MHKNICILEQYFGAFKTTPVNQTVNIVFKLSFFRFWVIQDWGFCHGDQCWNELLFPFTHFETGDDIAYAIAAAAFMIPLLAIIAWFINSQAFFIHLNSQAFISMLGLSLSFYIFSTQINLMLNYQLNLPKIQSNLMFKCQEISYQYCQVVHQRRMVKKRLGRQFNLKRLNSFFVHLLQKMYITTLTLVFEQPIF